MVEHATRLSREQTNITENMDVRMSWIWRPVHSRFVH